MVSNETGLKEQKEFVEQLTKSGQFNDASIAFDKIALPSSSSSADDLNFDVQSGRFGY